MMPETISAFEAAVGLFAAIAALAFSIYALLRADMRQMRGEMLTLRTELKAEIEASEGRLNASHKGECRKDRRSRRETGRSRRTCLGFGRARGPGRWQAGIPLPLHHPAERAAARSGGIGSQRAADFDGFSTICLQLRARMRCTPRCAGSAVPSPAGTLSLRSDGGDTAAGQFNGTQSFAIRPVAAQTDCRAAALRRCADKEAEAARSVAGDPAAVQGQNQTGALPLHGSVSAPRPSPVAWRTGLRNGRCRRDGGIES